MAYTLKQLVTAYTAIHGVAAPSADVVSTLQIMTNLSFTDQQVMSYILNSADSGAALAVLSYQFFTGKSPTAEGLAYLVNSPTNTTDLNDAYYAKFGLENRYINFSANLGVQGEGAAAFAGKYGALSFADYVASIYETIVGGTYAKAAGLDAAKAIADIVSRQDAIMATAVSSGMITPGMTQAQIDLALKAATAGYLLGEAIKADVGVYAASTNNFLVAVATGTAVYNTNITQSYAPAPTATGGAQGTGQTFTGTITLPGAPVDQPEQAPQPLSFTLTGGVDKFTGAATDDTFTGTSLTYGNGDILNGGAGRDTLNLTVTPGAGAQYSFPNDPTISIETINVTSDGGMTAYTALHTGLTELNLKAGRGNISLTTDTTTAVHVTATGQAASAIRIFAGTDVSVNSTGATTGTIEIGDSFTKATGAIVISREVASAGSAGTINVYGGKTVSVTQTAAHAVNTNQTNGVVTVNGSALTTEVTVNASKAASANSSTAGVTANSVTVNDVNRGSATDAGKITKASVDSYTTLNFNGTGLTDLSVAHGSSHIIIDNSSLTTPTNKTLNLTANGLTGGFLDDADVYTTLNVTTGAETSRLANITFNALKTLNVAGASQLSLTSASGMAHLETVKVSGAAGLIADLSGATVTSVDTSGTSGASRLTIDASKASLAGGAGADTIQLSSATVGKAIDLGGGDDTLTLASGTTYASITGLIDGGAGANTLSLSAATAVDIAAQSTAKFTGFQTIVLTGATTQTIDMSKLQGVASTVRTQGGNGLTLTQATSVQTLELTGAGTAYSLSGAWSGGNDALAVKLTDGSGSGVPFTVTGLTATGIETINITNTDTQSTPTGNFQNVLKLLGNSVKTITVSGNAGLTLTAASTALTGLDASGITKGDFAWTAGTISNATIKGSATGTNTINISGAGGVTTYTGGSGNDLVTATNGWDRTLNLGGGNNTVTGGGGYLTITAGDGNDTVTVAADSGNHTINLGNGTNSLTETGTYAITYKGGTGSDTLDLSSGAHTIDLGSGADSVTLQRAAGSGGTAYFAVITGFGTDDTLNIRPAAGVAAATSLGAQVTGQANLQAYMNAAVAGDGSITSIMRWFQWSGDTYVALDNSVSANFLGGGDNLVKLVGLLDLTGWQVTNGVLSI